MIFLDMISSATRSVAVNRLSQRERLRSAPYARSKPTKNASLKVATSKKLNFFLIRNPLDCQEPISLCDEIIILRGLVELKSDADEKQIRQSLRKAINETHPYIYDTDFDFMMATRRSLTKPVTSCEFNYNSVKLLVGQGAIYIKLKESKEYLLKDMLSSDEDKNDADGFEKVDEDNSSKVDEDNSSKVDEDNSSKVDEEHDIVQVDISLNDEQISMK